MMKKLSRIALLLLVYYSFLGVQSCIRCPRSVYRSYKLDKLDMTTVEYEFRGDSMYGFIASVDSIYEAGTFGLLLDFTLLKLSAIRTESFGNMAYAWQCPEPMFVNSDSFQILRVYTLHDFDAQHPQGAEVTELFKFIDYDYVTGRQVLVKRPLSHVQLLPTYVSAEDFTFPIFLDAAPASSRIVRFRFEAEMYNGQVLTQTSSEVYLQQ